MTALYILSTSISQALQYYLPSNRDTNILPSPSNNISMIQGIYMWDFDFNAMAKSCDSGISNNLFFITSNAIITQRLSWGWTNQWIIPFTNNLRLDLKEYGIIIISNAKYIWICHHSVNSFMKANRQISYDKI